jgi:hypothetical protein
VCISSDYPWLFAKNLMVNSYNMQNCREQLPQFDNGDIVIATSHLNTLVYFKN